MSEFQISYVSIWSKDFAKNRDVFAGVLQVPIAYEDADIVVFETTGAQLVLQRAVGADESLDGTVQFGFDVGNLDRVTHALRQAKQQIELDQENLSENHRVTVLRLPGGQTVEFVGR
jgi:catechol 2,3-dioxygenase-like lactoylglutathione lyase family enzyme